MRQHYKNVLEHQSYLSIRKGGEIFHQDLLDDIRVTNQQRWFAALVEPDKRHG